jgi:hypothetical protein
MGAARWLERREPARAVRFYEAALDAAPLSAVRTRAAWRLGLLWRRQGRIDAVRALWSDVALGRAPAPLGLLVDLAKLHEHATRDVPAALATARMALDRAEAEGLAAWRPEAVEALRHRVHRLERRARRVSMKEPGAATGSRRHPTGDGGSCRLVATPAGGAPQ